MIQIDNIIERISFDKIKIKYEKFIESKEKIWFFDSAPDLYLVLNKYRQIIFANKAVLKHLKTDDINDILGLRPGEALDCTYAYKNEAGCGTSEFCKECGAQKSILDAIDTSVNNKQECRIILKNNDAMDLRVYSIPINFQNEKYIIFTIKDISIEKRKELLERIFFHDIMNTASALKSYSELIAKFDLELNEENEFKDIIYNLSIRLIEEIKGQKILTNAENNQLLVNFESFEILPFINRIVNEFKQAFFAIDKQIIINSEIKNKYIKTDEVLLTRVLVNLLKNALESSKSNEIVTITISENEIDFVFCVHNLSFIPLNIQFQIFQRSFSTKGIGRGIGTYSIKLLTERYLKGKVYFSSNEEEGTNFFVQLPKR